MNLSLYTYLSSMSDENELVLPILSNDFSNHKWNILFCH